MQRKWICSILLILVVGNLSTDRWALAQGRLSDRDLERLMQNLRDDAPPFRQSFDNALKKSTIRKTSREQDARELADTFVKQANLALEIFKRRHKAENAVAAMVSTAGHIDPFVYSQQLNAQATARWEKSRAELHLVAQAFGIPEPYLAPQGGISTLSASTTGTCLNAVGIERSRQLVNECLQVSPATHPPCHAQNACSLIVDEIKRGCVMIAQGAPGFCAEYR